MLNDDQQTKIKDFISSAQNILVVIGKNPSLDQLTAASALVLALKGLNKEVSFISPEPVADQYQEIFGVEMLSHQLGKQNLVVAFDYQPDQVDKVSYHIGEDTNKFYLTIKPKKGVKPLDCKKVEYIYTGSDADLIFLVGVHDYESLDNLYFGFEQTYAEATVISIHTFATAIGDLKVDTSKMLCISEAMFDIFDELGLSITSEIASNLYMSLQAKTDNFTSLTATADTFEIAAELIRSGAKRKTQLVSQLLAISSKTESTPELPEKSADFKPKDQEIKVEPKKVTRSAANKSSTKSTNNKKASADEQLASQGDLNYQPGGFSK